MMEASMLDLTRGLAGFPHRLFDMSALEVDIEVVGLDPDDEAFAEHSDGRIEEPYELSPSQVITLAVA